MIKNIFMEFLSIIYIILYCIIFYCIVPYCTHFSPQFLCFMMIRIKSIQVNKNAMIFFIMSYMSNISLWP